MSADDEKQNAIGLLEREWHALDTWLRLLDERQLDRPVFTDGVGWRVRDLIAHLAWWQELAARVAEKMASEGGAPDGGSRAFVGIDATPDDLNAETHATWRERPVTERLERWVAAHRRMMAALSALRPDQLLQADGGMEGLKLYVAVPALIHLRMHRENIEAALKETATT